MAPRSIHGLANLSVSGKGARKVRVSPSATISACPGRATEAAASAEVDVDAALAWRDFMVSDHTDDGAARWLAEHGIELLRGSGRLAGAGVVEVEIGEVDLHERRVVGAHRHREGELRPRNVGGVVGEADEILPVEVGREGVRRFVGGDGVPCPGAGFELHPSDRALAGGGEVLAEARLHIVDRGQIRPSLRS